MKQSFIAILIVFFFGTIHAQDFITETRSNNSFAIVSDNKATPIYIDQNADTLIHIAAHLLQKDIAAVTGHQPQIIHNLSAGLKQVIIIGIVDKDPLLVGLAKDKKLNANALKGKWEAFQLQTIKSPTKGVDKALIITGSDRRGTAYAVLELSKQLGVSPWYWWADVPVTKRHNTYFKNGVYFYDSPSVKYRGIFINDEEPAFGGWAREKFGGINSKMYVHIFELLLRLKGNYLWPAMWGKAFNEDDPENPKLAHAYGIVMGTSHHEPMMRAQKEWTTHKKEYGGAWNYYTNKEGLLKFWEDGFRRNKDYDNIVTLGMRGDGDEPMPDLGSIEANYQLLESIIKDQRNIIEQITGRPAHETPQMWALYKEVQEYYDRGMKAPDDVTLLLCDDNWGNIRRMPPSNARKRSGGYGIYYHYDYVGGPRNYKWINTNNIARVWEQMHIAYEYGADKVWIVNVGDLKPMELPISFFLDYAWDVKRWNASNLRSYYTYWAEQQFGKSYAKEIGDIMRKYALYASRRKPELLNANTYSILNYNEAEKITKDWNQLLEEAQKIYNLIPATHKDAYYQLVLHPVKAYGNLQNMYTAHAWNQYYAKQNNTLANEYAEKVKHFYQQDSLITLEYHSINNGKWNHMMAQKHIGYTFWQEPRVQRMPEVQYVTNGTDNKPYAPDATIKTARDLIKGTPDRNSFYEQNGYVSIAAVHYSAKKDIGSLYWTTIPDIGKCGDGITLNPVTYQHKNNQAQAVLEYDIYTYSQEDFEIQAWFSPTLNFNNEKEGMQYAISVDNETPQTISVNKEAVDSRDWSMWVSNNIIIKKSKHHINQPGRHTVKIFCNTPGLVLQKLIVDFGGLQYSYLGPSETIVHKKK